MPSTNLPAWNASGTAFPERVGLLAAVGLSGLTFGRSLMPRTLLGQTVITGLWGAATYGLVTSTESAVIAAANTIATRVEHRADYRAAHSQAFGYAAHIAAAGLGWAIEKSLPHHPHEKLWRSAVRTSGVFIHHAATAGTAALAVLDLTSRTGRATRSDDPHDYANTPWYGQIGALTATGGAVAAATVYRQRRRAARFDAQRPTLPRPEKPGHSAALAVASGTAAAVAIVGFGKVEGLASRGVAALVRPALGPHGHYAPLLGRIATATGIGIGVAGAVASLYRSLEQASEAIEDAYRTPPTSLTVSGGPASTVPWLSLSREGRRFVNMALSAADITAVTKTSAKSPVRTFIGEASAPTPLDRALQAIDELEKLGGFTRSVICVASPTGTGYVNPTVTEALEFLTGGDCATVAIQYSLRPSVLSLDRIKIARASNTALLTLLKRRIDDLPAQKRPRLVGLGESLGALTFQNVALHEGLEGLTRFGIHRGLFIGTPAASKWAKEWRSAPHVMDPTGQIVEVASAAEWNSLPELVQRRARFVLLTHHEDPVAKFGLDIMLRRPSWLDPQFPRRLGVPPEMRWRPLLTGFITLADVIGAQDPSPGDFQAFGHDYRADIAQFTALAFGIPADQESLSRIDHTLRERDAFWVTQRAGTAWLSRRTAATQLPRAPRFRWWSRGGKVTK